MGDSKPSRESSGGVRAASRESLSNTLVSDRRQVEKAYAECLLTGQLPPEMLAAVEVNIDSGGSMDAEHTVLAGSIAPAQRKVGPSLEVRELGRGGIGRVYVSVDMGLGREIAIKEILPELLEDAPETARGLRARFLREARVTGQLEHPNIVPVYEVGQRDDGSLYYAMRLIRGKTLKEAIDRSRSLRERLALLNHFLGLCHAIAYAHGRGVIHRDIKPQNVMLGEFGETVVLDWGVAKVRHTPGGVTESGHPEPERRAIREPDHGLPEATRVGQVLGTPMYMAPEALRGETDNVDAPSDVWSLGVVLYLLLTGKPPFRGNLAKLVTNAGRLAAKPAHLVDPEVPPELSAVAEHALQQDPLQRYQTAQAMAADIEAYLTGAKVGVYAYSSWQLARRFYNKQRAAVWVVLVALLSMLVLASVSYSGVIEARDRALMAERQQRQSAEDARARLAQLYAENAEFSLARGDTASAELLATHSLSINPSQEALGIVASVAPAGQPRLLESRDFGAHCAVAAGSTSGALLVCGGGRRVFALTDTRTLLAEHGAKVTGVGVLADGKQGFSVDSRGVLKRWTFGAVGQAKLALQLGRASALALSPDRNSVLIGFEDGHLEVRDARSLELVATRELGEPVSKLSVSAQGAVAAGGRFGALRLWPDPAAERVLEFRGHHGTLTALAFSPDGALLATGSSDRNVRVWLGNEPAQHPSLLASGRVATSFAWSQSGAHLLYGTREHRVYWVDMRLKRTIAELPGYMQGLVHVAFTEDDKQLSSLDGRARRRTWGIPGQGWRERLVEPANVLALARTSRPEGLVSGGLGIHGLCLWDLKLGRCQTRLPFMTEQVRALGVSADGKYLAAGGSAGHLMVWDLEKKVPLTALMGHSADVRGVAFSQRGAQVVSGDLSGKLALWSVRDGQRLRERALASGINAVAVDPSGTQLSVATRANTIEVWDSSLAKRRAVLYGHSEWVMALAYLPDGSLASGGADGSVRLWDMQHYGPQKSFGSTRGRLLSVAVSDDGRYLAAAGEDRVVRLWDLAKGSLSMTLRDHEGAVRSLQFLGNRRLASASDDRSVRLWDLRVLDQAPASLLAAAEARTGVRADSLASLE